MGYLIPQFYLVRMTSCAITTRSVSYIFAVLPFYILVACGAPCMPCGNILLYPDGLGPCPYDFLPYPFPILSTCNPSCAADCTPFFGPSLDSIYPCPFLPEPCYRSPLRPSVPRPYPIMYSSRYPPPLDMIVIRTIRK